MGVCADDNIACHGQTFFGKQGVLDTHFAYFKIVGDFVSSGKFSYAFAVFCGFDILIGYKMIGNQGNFILVEYAVHLHFFHFLNSNRTGNVVAQHQVQIRLYQLTGFYLVKACMSRQNFLCHGHSHL